jgi:hypothetical protein
LEWLQLAARDALAFVTDVVAAVSAAGWVCIVVAALALLWVWAGMHASTRLGPIEVVPLEHDDEAPPALRALTASFRERLSRCGLTPPPTVPAGAPQANLIKAVEGSAPQGPMIARLLEMLPSPPRPAEYKVTGTLSGTEGTGRNPCGVSFWLQPVNVGAPYLQTIPDCSTHTDALTRAASDIYLHIAKATPEAFPLWVRWRTPEALEAYLDGCGLRKKEGELSEAITKFEEAVDASPFNALALLQLANLDEQRAAGASQRWAIAYLQARALERYLAIGRLWPTLVEARYRCGVTAAQLATSYDALETAEQEAIAALLPLAPPQNMTNQLRRLADRETSATVQLLKPSYVLAREHRLRNQFESKGRDRRSLTHTVRISRHGLRMARRNAKPSGGWWPLVRYDDIRVHVFHMLLGKANITWQGRYNAACFDALQLEVDRMRDGRRARVERRARRNVDLAIRESGGELTRAWVTNDPALAYFNA